MAVLQGTKALESYFDGFFGEEFSWLPSKNKVADEDLHLQRHTIFLVKFQCLVLELLFIN